MTAAPFLTAPTLEAALEALAGGARPIAGGTDLVVGARQGKAPLPASLVAIHRLTELGGLREEPEGGLRLGALVSHRAVVEHPLVRERFTALADASAIVGSDATRANGTIGGNVMNASPAMDTGAPLLCFDGVVRLVSLEGARELPLADLLAGPGRTTAGPNELLESILLPPPPAGRFGSCYGRLGYRRQMEIAVVGAAAAVSLDGGSITSARVAITALRPFVARVAEAEAALLGSHGDAAAIAAAASAAARAATPISDVRGSAAYRQAMAEVIARRVIAIALERARGGTVPVPASSSLHDGVARAH